MLIMMLLMDSNCGALQGLSLLHHIDLESRRMQLHLRFARAQFGGKSLHLLASAEGPI